MLFNTYEFLLLFLPLTLLVYGLVGRFVPSACRWVLIVANAIFYLNAGVGYFALLVLMTAITFFGVKYALADGRPTRRRIGLIAVLSNLVLLLFFKYANLLMTPLSGGLVNLILPLGISFYTFNLVSYGLDVYRGITQPEQSFTAFLATITFFPTVLSGPLTRYSQIQPQLDEPKPDIEQGVFMLCLGLAKKVLIADGIAAIINPLWTASDSLGLIAAWVAVIGYAYQLYFDFSGYTDMATGISYLLGVQLPQNFNAPYSARNITEFWQRWHMTLSSWFRDYLFLPLSRALLRRKQPADRARSLSLILTMILTGAWHGASGIFILWGTYHGLLLAAHAQTRAWRWRTLPVWLARPLTFIAVLLGWVIFRSPSLEIAGHIYTGMFGLRGLGLEALLVNGGTLRYTHLAVLGLLLLATNLSRDSWSLRPRSGAIYALGLAILFALSLIFMGKPAPFLYFQF